MARGKYRRKRTRKEYALVPISSMGFPARLVSVLERNSISTLADLVCKSKSDLLSLSGLGEASLDMVIERLAQRNAGLRE